MVHIIPLHVKTRHSGGRALVKPPLSAKGKLVMVRWEFVDRLPDGYEIFALSNAEQLRKAGIKFMIDNVSEMEVWSASRDLERWG